MVLHLSQVSNCIVLINLRNNVLNFAVFTTAFEFKIGSRASTNIRCYHDNSLVMTLIMAIFEHPPWISSCMQIWVGGQNFTFPTLFDSYRELLLKCVFGYILGQHYKYSFSINFSIMINALLFSLFCSLEVQVNDHTNYNRLTSFLGCRREILGNSSVLCLSFRLNHGQNVADSPLGVMACLSQRGKLFLVLYFHLCKFITLQDRKEDGFLSGSIVSY